MSFIKVVVALVLIFSMLIPGQLVLAAVDPAVITNVTAEADMQENTIAVNGIISSGMGNGVIIKVYDTLGELNYLDQTVSGIGGKFSFKFKARGVLSGSYSIKIGGDAIAQEFSTTLKIISEEVDKSLLSAKITEAQGLAETKYTPESWQAFQTVLIDSIAVNDDPQVTQQEVDTALGNLETAIDGLVSAGPCAVLSGASNIDPEEAFTLAISINNLTQNIYGEDITITFDPEVFEYTGSTGANEDISIVETDTKLAGTVRIICASIGGITGESTSLLNANFKALGGVSGISSNISLIKVELGINDGNVIIAGTDSMVITINIPVDKSGLTQAIEAAQSALNDAVEGNMKGQYPIGSKAVLQNAINSAASVNSDENADQSEVDTAISVLNAALNDFLALKRVKDVGDLNNNDGFDIGDLAMIAFHYGETSEGENWQTAKIADINDDGKVDILDLAYVAKQILGK